MLSTTRRTSRGLAEPAVCPTHHRARPMTCSRCPHSPTTPRPRSGSDTGTYGTRGTGRPSPRPPSLRSRTAAGRSPIPTVRSRWSASSRRRCHSPARAPIVCSSNVAGSGVWSRRRCDSSATSSPSRRSVRRTDSSCSAISWWCCPWVERRSLHHEPRSKTGLSRENSSAYALLVTTNRTTPSTSGAMATSQGNGRRGGGRGGVGTLTSAGSADDRIRGGRAKPSRPSAIDVVSPTAVEPRYQVTSVLPAWTTSPGCQSRRLVMGTPS